MSLADLIYRFRWPGFFLVLGFTIVSLLLLPKMRIEVDFADFFPIGDPELEFYEAYKNRLGSEDNFLSVAIVPEGRVFDISFLTTLSSFTQACSEIDGVKSTSSLTTISRMFSTGFGFGQMPYVDLNEPTGWETDSLRIVRQLEFTGNYYFPEAGAVAVVVEMDEHLSLAGADSLIASIESFASTFAFDEFHLGGKRFLEVSYNRLVRSELRSSILASLALIVVALAFIFRSVAGVLIPLGSMILALIIQYGYMAFFGRPLGILANLFPTIVLIIGISDVVHIGTKYDQEIQENRGRQDALLRTIKMIGTAILLTSLTTAAGFLTFRTSVMAGLRDFGLDAAIAVMIAFGVTILFVPAILSSFRSERVFSNQSFHSYWGRITSNLGRLITAHPGKIFLSTALLLVIAAVGVGRINTNNKLLVSVPDGQRVKDDFQFYDEKLGGIRTLELAVETSGDARLDAVGVLTELEKLHDYLVQDPRFNHIRTPISQYQAMRHVFHPDGDPEIRFSESDDALRFELSIAKPFIDRLQYRMIDSTYTLGRIVFRTSDPGRKEVEQIYEQLDAWIAANMDNSLMEFRPTGLHQMIDRGHEHRIANMYWGLVMALGVVALLIGLLLRSVRLIFFSLLVNIVPLVLVAGVMGFFGIELRGTTTIIFTVGFVIAVDNTIHFLSQYSLRLKDRMQKNAAIEATVRHTGKAIITTTTILMGGFLILLHSGSWEVYIHGVLVSAVLLFSLLTNLILLPALLRYGRNERLETDGTPKYR